MGAVYFTLFRVLPYLTLAWFCLGLVLRLRGLARAPVPFWIALEPLPGRSLGRAGRLFSGAPCFPALWRRAPLLALGATALHLGLLLALAGHLRHFLSPVPAWLYFLAPLGRLGGYLMAAGLVLLCLRRLADPRLLYLSRPADYGLLALLLALALSGLALAHFAPADPAAVKALALGLLRPWAPAGPWPGWLLGLHLGLALALLAVFPLSKLVHGPEFVLNPVLFPARGSRLPRNPWQAAYVGDAPSQEAVLPGEPQPWTRERYCRRLKDYWAGAGTRRVLGARERAASRRQGDGA